MNKYDWDKATIMLRSLGAGKVTLKDGVLTQEGKSPLQLSTSRVHSKVGVAVAAKTEAGSAIFAVDQTGVGTLLFPIWKKVLVNPVTLNWLLKWFFKRLLGFNKIRQK